MAFSKTEPQPSKWQGCSTSSLFRGLDQEHAGRAPTTRRIKGRGQNRLAIVSPRLLVLLAHLAEKQVPETDGAADLAQRQMAPPVVGPRRLCSP